MKYAAAQQPVLFRCGFDNRKDSLVKTGKKDFIILLIKLTIAVVIFSLCSVLAKIASGYPLLSWGFILYYGLAMAMTLVSAIIWQFCLKKIDVVTAYMYKATSQIWYLVWSVVLFKEVITIGNVVGSLLILFGIVLLMEDKK